MEYVPAGQDEQAAAPLRGDLGPNVPAGHPRQSAELVLPVLAVYVPVGHAMQPTAPADENVPRVQSVQEASLVAPNTLEYLPAGQLEQPVLPEFGWNVPPKHLLQTGLPSVTVYSPAGQFSHCVWPAVDWNWPTGHKVHVEPCVPAVALKEPEGQGVPVHRQPNHVHQTDQVGNLQAALCVPVAHWLHTTGDPMRMAVTEIRAIWLKSDAACIRTAMYLQVSDFLKRSRDLNPSHSPCHHSFSAGCGRVERQTYHHNWHKAGRSLQRH